ncbi:hypothetical protein QTQ03_16710 [Micromonospora sp. WMMA1363]|uniref:hypothetical protein n=1 Tax=Micromonospora sp. WMMA1363 TaxID=3053985 RepID=UPI00259D23EF|nr:hypothetical protein [Micromonospora sp. WMMA1363]MDM4721161.1 hypothetical protein [Micromonospora sp. WMMA1363]
MAGGDFGRAAKQSSGLTDRMAKLGNIVDGASTAIGDAAGTMQALADIETSTARKAAEHARALNDLEQAQADVNQALIDGKQATLDVGQAHLDAEQAVLDAETAQQEYNEAVKEHGKNSAEARQASLDLRQAQEDLKQANLDVEQATQDATQATIDAESAQLDANEAMMAANPPDLQKWADQMNLVAPLLQGLVGVVALVTAAQWAWNAAQLASPVTWIIIGIVALVAAIILIATKTDWFARAWRASWKWIKDAASGAWNFIRRIPGWTASAFGKIASVISWPYRMAFNLISTAWNSTVGRLRWTVPSWVPKVGGNSISAPRLPKFHSGGKVPGPPGSEMLAVLQAGETVTPAGTGGGVTIHVQAGPGAPMERAFADMFLALLRAGAIRLSVQQGRVQPA